MKVGWVRDSGNADGTAGGAELTMDEFYRAAPERVEFAPVDQAEVVVLGNVHAFDDSLIERLEGRRIVRYVHDLDRSGDPDLLAFLDLYAETIYTSPLHREVAVGDDWPEDERGPRVIPPPIDLERFRPNRQTRRHGKREGVVSVATWQGPGKGAHLVSETCHRAGIEVDVYGTGTFLPYGSHVHNKGPVSQADLPSILWQYEQFVFLPTVLEPFGRCVVEAHVAGCEILTNKLVGSRFYIENGLDPIATSTEDFWTVVLDG